MKYFDQEKADKLLKVIKEVDDWDAARPDSFWAKNPTEAEKKEVADWQAKMPSKDKQAKYRENKKELGNMPYRFEVGDGATSGGNGDRYPYRVVWVNETGKTVKVQAMDHKAARKGLPMGHQEWIISDNTDNPITTITLRSNGKWAEKGRKSTNGFGNFWFGAAYSYNWEF